MQSIRSNSLHFVLKLLTCALILRVTVGVVLRYRYYLPPDFGSDFLHGRESYFFGPYQWAFYAHIVSGPCSLIFGLILLSGRFRLRFPAWHRRLGKIQTACVLLLVAPSGAWMALHAETGAMAGAAFALMAAATALSVWFGWRSAVKRRFAEHRRWMSRCFLLLCSAVVVRLIGGIGVVAGIHGDWAYPLGAWMSLLLPVGVFELITGSFGRSFSRRRPHPQQS
jgi:Predicted membrane protein (DUF2306)